MPDGACGYVAPAFLPATLRALQDDGVSGLSSLNFKAMLPTIVHTIVSTDSVHKLSKELGNGTTVPKGALKVNWLEAGDISAIQARSIVQHWQELTRATSTSTDSEKCRGTSQVRLWCQHWQPEPPGQRGPAADAQGHGPRTRAPGRAPAAPPSDMMPRHRRASSRFPVPVGAPAPLAASINPRSPAESKVRGLRV